MTEHCPFPPGTHLAAYLRDSGGEEQELSTLQQENELRRWCAEHNLILSRLFTDAARPGSSTVGREQFGEMLAYFRTDPLESGLLIWSWSRFARNSDDAAYYRAELRRRGVLIHSLKDNIPGGKEGRVFEALIDYVNEKRLDEISTDVKRGLRHLVEQYGCVPGTPPRGFMREPIEIGQRRGGKTHIAHRWVPDPLLISKVRQAWQMRAEGASYHDIQKATGLYSTINSWSTFFRNRLYIGELVFGDLVIPNYCEPIIEPTTWEAVRLIEAERTPHNLQPDKPDHPRRMHSTGLLSGLVRCGKCNSPMNIDITAPKGKPSFAYYRCSGSTRRRDCDAKRIPQDWLEQQVLENIELYLLSPENIANLHAEVLAEKNIHNQTFTGRSFDLKIAIARLQNQVENTTNAIAELGSSPALLRKLKSLEGEQFRLEQEFASLKMTHEQDDDLQLIPPDELYGFMLSRMERAKANPDSSELKQLLRTFVVKITAVRDGRVIDGEIIYGLPKTKSREPDDEPSPHNIIFMSTLPAPVGALKNHSPGWFFCSNRCPH